MRYPAAPSLSPRALAGALLGAGAGEPPRLGGLERRAQLCHRGRTAVALACAALGLRRGDVVLAPAYNCGMEIDALLAHGLDVRLYRVDSAARVDLGALEALLRAGAKAVYVIHYFGWDSDLEAVANLCVGAGALLIEDCALALFSRGVTGRLGEMGAASIYSLTKSLPVPDGGAIVVSESSVGRNEALHLRLTPPPRRGMRRRLLRRALASWSARPRPDQPALVVQPPPGGSSPATAPASPDALSGIAGPASRTERRSGTQRRPMPDSYYFVPGEADWDASRATRSILARLNPAEIFARRRHNYQSLQAAMLNVSGLRPLKEALPEGVCPLNLPLLAEDREDAFRRLASIGVAAIRWWAGYHRSLRWDGFPDACLLKDCVLALPVHQGLDDDAISRMAAAIQTAFGSRRDRPAPVSRTAVVRGVPDMAVSRELGRSRAEPVITEGLSA